MSTSRSEMNRSDTNRSDTSRSDTSRSDTNRSDTSGSPCELCEAARLTTWWYEDDLCWVAECEACFVPMVVWRRHGAIPPDDVRAHLLARLRDVADDHGPRDYWIDDTLRSIPDHYHAHARRRPYA